ncbi:MAG TPA: hypothetical protein DEH22_12670, partial [Chloroflexi bacterium]|nr:hypothetical protein [Chloroflexota bacterium]
MSRATSITAIASTAPVKLGVCASFARFARRATARWRSCACSTASIRAKLAICAKFSTPQVRLKIFFT